MTVINKQKFLAELGRLLTFMYEEDRQSALEMYEKIFDSCPDIHALMQILVSPTRQAVEIARAYNAADRKLQIQSVSREDEGGEDSGELPDFVLAIDKIYQQAYAKGLIEEDEPSTPVLENQISFFDEVDPSLFEPDEDEIELVEESVEKEASEEVCEEAPVEEIPTEEAPAEESLPVDEVDAFLASFSIDEKELVPVDTKETVEEIPEEPAKEEPAAEVVEKEIAPTQAELEIVENPTEESIPNTETIRKARPFLLVLYTLFAIPLTAAGLALLLVPAALVLVLAALVVLAGSASFAAAFSGFAVFADMLVILGTALIVSAVGLILLWLFVWFIGGAMTGFVKSVVRLGKKCCYKEVPAV